MDLKDIVTVAIASIIVLVVAHLAVFYVVKTLYPPAPVVPPAYVPIAPGPVYMPPAEQVQHVSIPTVASPPPLDAPREEEPRRGPPPPEATSIHGNSGVDSAQA
jgi:hypothetical protein